MIVGTSGVSVNTDAGAGIPGGEAGVFESTGVYLASSANALQGARKPPL